MDSAILQQLKEYLVKNDKIGIVVGKNPGLDEMGAGLALYLSLLSAGKNVKIACPTEPIVELSRLVGIDKVKTSFENGSGDLTVSFPYREGEIEKVSYTVEEGFLNIVVKAGAAGLSFNEEDIRYKRSSGVSKLMFVIGASGLSELQSLFEIENLKDVIIVNIDNKAENQGFGDIVLVSRGFSSICEGVADLIVSLNLPLDVDGAQNLMSGICGATNNFQNSETTPLAFEMAAFLLGKGAVRPETLPSKTKVKEEAFFMPKSQNQAKVIQKQEKPETKKTPPDDWLTPKIYKGSTMI